MFRHLMLPLDGSSFAEEAVPVAVEVARRSGAVLDLVHVRRPDDQPAEVVRASLASTGDYDELAEPAYLEAVRARIPAGVSTTSVTLAGPAVAPALSAHARDRGADLIVMTTHGRGGLARAWLGSVTDRLLREVETPVLLIRPSEHSAEPRPADLFRRVLIPLDDCTRTEKILEPAIALGGLAKATYTLLRVITPSTWSAHYHDRRERSEQDAVEHAQAVRQLQRVAARMQLGPEEVTIEAVRHRTAAPAILEHATHGFDLIALSTHGHGDMGRFLLGSVADKVLRGATIPVLCCHASPLRTRTGGR